MFREARCQGKTFQVIESAQPGVRWCRHGRAREKSTFNSLKLEPGSRAKGGLPTRAWPTDLSHFMVLSKAPWASPSAGCPSSLLGPAHQAPPIPMGASSGLPPAGSLPGTTLSSV